VILSLTSVQEESNFQKDLMEDEQHASAPAPAPAPQNLPPVVTYPEFLVKNKAPPLVTTDMLLNTMYAASGTMAGLYALSKYALEPMHKSLSEARHEFFSFSGEKLDDLNSRIDKLAPNASKNPTKKTADVADNASETSEDSDPTELFHRDIGVQTDVELERKTSSWSLQESEEAEKDTVTKHETRLTNLTKHLRDLEESGNMSDGRETEVHDQLEVFSSYLNDVLYTSPYYSWKNSVPSWGNTQNATSNDEFDKFKQEIRSIKGAMLSSRNFPRGA
jgi:hypothetical protein